MKPLEILSNRWKKDNTLQWLIVGVLLFAGCMIWHSSILGYLSAIILFTVFDIFGFNNVQFIDAADKKNAGEGTVNYRIIQFMFQFLLYTFYYVCCGWSTVVAFMIAHWFTTSDKFFYIFQKVKYDGTYPWLENWSVFLPLKLLGNKEVTNDEFNLLAFLGFVIGCIVAILF